jgi:hypothetical protein
VLNIDSGNGVMLQSNVLSSACHASNVRSRRQPALSFLQPAFANLRLLVSEEKVVSITLPV